MPDAPPPVPTAPLGPPEVRPPTVTKAPPAGRKFPCPACGARLDFDPHSAGLKCPYCGYVEAVEAGDHGQVVERDFEEYLAREDSKGTVLPGHATQVRCTGCGAVVLLEDKVATDRCPFCLTHLESEPEAAKAMIPPESVLPFAVELRKARERFSTWLESLWFAPSELKKVATLGQLTGVYLPFWTYDSMTYTRYNGLRGNNYTDTEYYTETKPDGSTEQKSRTVVRIAWFPVSGEIRHFFDDVLVCGSKSVPADLIADLPPWDLPDLAPFRPDYLSGFTTERYAIGLKDGFTAAKGEMEPEIVRLIRRDIGGDHQQIHAKDTRYSAITFKHLLLPAWVAAYRYHDQTYQILVNGRTGKVSGYRPYSWSKILAAVLLGAAAVAVVAAVVMSLKH